MPEEKNQQKPAGKLTIEIKEMDTTAHNIKSKYLDPIAEKRKASFHSGEVMKLSFIAFAADCIGLPVGSAERAKFFAQLDATPGFFGSGNNSACRQHYEKKGGVAEVAASYTDL